MKTLKKLFEFIACVIMVVTMCVAGTKIAEGKTTEAETVRETSLLKCYSGNMQVYAVTVYLDKLYQQGVFWYAVTTSGKTVRTTLNCVIESNK